MWLRSLILNWEARNFLTVSIILVSFSSNTISPTYTSRTIIVVEEVCTNILIARGLFEAKLDKSCN